MDEASLVNSLRSGDESAFVWLVEQYHTSLVRLARMFVQDEPTAEELVQETWLAVLRGLEKFERRSSLKTWIFTILTNKAKTRGQREKRTLSFSDLDDSASDSPTVDPDRFRPASEGIWEGHWWNGPTPWREVPEDSMLYSESMKIILRSIDTLPETQRAVITLRDIHELSSDEVCNVLNISETNQRVLLHRARARVRQALENYLQLEK
jgi:RNA polymerase sigma-70 factor (ECF subfamily)